MKPKLENKDRSKWECLLAISPFAALLLSGCGHTDSGAPSAPMGASGGSGGVLAAMRPRASEAMIEKIRAQEAITNPVNGQGQPVSSGGNPFTGMNGLGGRVLPKVITDPIAPPAEEVAQADAVVSSVGDPDPNANVQQVANTTTTNNTAMTYGTNYTNPTPAPPPGALGGGLVPPPPAVTLSTQAQPVTAMAGDPNNPYGGGGYPYPGGGYPNPYANPYMNPYAMPYPPQQAAPVATPRPALFGSSTGTRPSNSDDSDSAPAKRRNANFVPITPTGMDSRSPYKQRDELKMLWKGVLSSSSLMNTVSSDAKILEQVGKLEVGLPADATKGSFSLSQRQVDAVFKSSVPGVDRRVVAPVRKLESNLVQSYYRYLYTYNKFCLAQQTVGARKQEIDVAATQSEQQRATADLSQAQGDLDSSKEDMKSSQIELAQASSVSAARAVISKVSGVAPALEALKAPDESSSEPSKQHGFGFPNFNLFHGKSANDKKDSAEASAENGGSEGSADSDEASGKDAKKAQKRDKGSKDKSAKEKDDKDKSPKNKKLKVVAGDKEADLAPAPAGESASSSSSTAIASVAGSKPVGSLAAAGIAFNLKEVQISARKSILSVTIHNSGSEAFNFNSDSISVSEGNRKLPDAATRSEFDSTLIQPDGDVKGTITIFGRPWNEKLSVSLTQDGKSIQLKR